MSEPLDELTLEHLLVSFAKQAVSGISMRERAERRTPELIAAEAFDRGSSQWKAMIRVRIGMFRWKRKGNRILLLACPRRQDIWLEYPRFVND